MLFGDGIITPAISVISAVEGLGVATQDAQPFIIPISCAVLMGLFLIQSRGTEKVGRLFAPAMAAWFLAIGILGIIAIVREPRILAALGPWHALRFVTNHGIFGFLIFGAVVLAVTGVEALYADLSHFGRKPISNAWFFLVFPALTLNYFGQGAHLLTDPSALNSPFFSLAPAWLVLPLVVLATVATVIASQALISGAFTLTEQAINLHLWPRMRVEHTSAEHQGQVYVPSVNVFLAVACILLVLTFRSSDRLAAAYGLAVSTTMLATSIAFYVAVRDVLHWKKRYAVPLVTLFVIVDATFVLSSLQKIFEGAWVPLALSVAFVTTALTWLEGRRCVAKCLLAMQMPLDRYLAGARPSDAEPQGTMVFLTGNPDGVPFIGSKHRWVRARADEEHVVLLHLVRGRRPRIEDAERVNIERVSHRLTIVRATFGYMERPTIRPVFDACALSGLHLDSDETSFFYADENRARRCRPVAGLDAQLFRHLGTQRAAARRRYGDRSGASRGAWSRGRNLAGASRRRDITMI
jgi:KUP system potassium uptake protein